MKGETPQLSVVMPVHNALPYLDAAVESILGQTFSDFEFVILNDASTDGSAERLREWAAKDKRIRLLQSDKNLGPAGSSQFIALAASAPIVARMDADDISHPDRLQEEFQTLQANPDVGVVACLFTTIDSKGRQIRQPEPWRLLRRSTFVPFSHGSIMYRRPVFDQVGGYREQCVYWEDHDLMARMAAVSDVLVIPRSLYQYRQSAGSTRFTSGDEQLERALDLMYRCIPKLDEGLDYDSILAEPAAADRKIDPRSYVSLGSVVLWAGHRPRLFRRLLKRGRLSLDFASLSAILWTAWAAVAPETLRQFLLLLVQVRNSAATSKIQPTLPVRWSPRGRNSGRSALQQGHGRSSQEPVVLEERKATGN